MRRLYPPVDADTQARWDAAYARARDPRRVGETMGGPDRAEPESRSPDELPVDEALPSE